MTFEQANRIGNYGLFGIELEFSLCCSCSREQECCCSDTQKEDRYEIVRKCNYYNEVVYDI